jgi:DNA-binding beta-propeller fold protein YncE
MPRAAFVAALGLAFGFALAQPPSDPALLIPQAAPELDYIAIPNTFDLPEGITMGAPASVLFDSTQHLFVLNRGAQPLMEFDRDQKFIRAFGEPLRRAHGFRLDDAGNFWITDVGAHFVEKLDSQGNVLLTLGTKGQPGAWDEAAGSRLLNEPNDLAFGRNGDIFLVEGHSPGKGDPRVLKFDKNGNFLKTWGGEGTAPGKFNVAHAIALDAKGQLWIADRENQRIQVFDQGGAFIQQMKYAGLPCSFQIGDQNIFMVNGFTGQLLKLDLSGNVLAVTGKPGKGLGEFGEAHFVAVSPTGEIYVADTTGRLHKFVKKN